MVAPGLARSQSVDDLTDPVAKIAPFPACRETLRLRILQTTDVHGHLLPFDYYTNQSDRPWGLARLATLIRHARSEVGAANCLLLDNGDVMQGTPLTDLTAQRDQGWTGPHPVISAMNEIGLADGNPGAGALSLDLLQCPDPARRNADRGYAAPAALSAAYPPDAG